MKDELKVFENRSDDWLAKQREEEAKISVWDLDDAKILKEEHEKIHHEKDIKKQEFKNLQTYNKKVSYGNNKQNNPPIVTILSIIVFIVIVFTMITIVISGNSFGALPMIVIFYLLGASLKGKKKR